MNNFKLTACWSHKQWLSNSNEKLCLEPPYICGIMEKCLSHQGSRYIWGFEGQKGPSLAIHPGLVTERRHHPFSIESFSEKMTKPFFKGLKVHVYLSHTSRQAAQFLDHGTNHPTVVLYVLCRPAVAAGKPETTCCCL